MKEEYIGCLVTFMQDNLSRSVKNVLRGLHYQIQHPQGKLARVTEGAAFDIAVELSRSLHYFSKWVGVDFLPIISDNFGFLPALRMDLS